MMRPKRTCTAADTAGAAPAKRVRRGVADGAVSTGKAATGVEQRGAGPVVPCVQVTTSGHIKGAAADSRSHTITVMETAVASPCGRQAGPAASNSEQAAAPSARGLTAACSAARGVPSSPAAEPPREHEQAVAAAAAASTAAADVPLSSAHTAAEAHSAGDTDICMHEDADLTERLRIAAHCFEERHANYSRLYECASLPAVASSSAPVLRVMAGQADIQCSALQAACLLSAYASGQLCVCALLLTSAIPWPAAEASFCSVPVNSACGS